MKVLVTGSSGFLGKFLCKALEKKGYELTKTNSQNCDLTKADSLNQFNHLTFDWIIHLAVWTQAGDFCLKYPADQWLINQKINVNTLSWWKEHMPKAKLITMGTSCAYDETLPLEEEYYLKGRPIDSLLAYGMTKRMLYTGLLSMHKQYGLDYLCFIPSTLYGPYYHTDERQLHFIFDLIAKILKAKFYGKEVVLWGDGEQKRELIHIDDFVKIAISMMETQKNQIINVGAGKEHSIRDFAQRICKITGFDFNQIEFDLTRYVGARSKILSIEKMQKILPQYEKTSLDDGLKETIDWFVENKEKLLAKGN